MRSKCPSGKRAFQTETLAVDVLLELWSKNTYSSGNGPIAVYRCEDCGEYHLTSHGSMHPKLSEYLAGKTVNLDREANKWIDKFKKR
jgi:hypothetical protein